MFAVRCWPYGAGAIIGQAAGANTRNCVTLRNDDRPLFPKHNRVFFLPIFSVSSDFPDAKKPVLPGKIVRGKLTPDCLG